MAGTPQIAKQAGTVGLIGAAGGAALSLLLNAAYSLTSDGAGLPVPPWQGALETLARPALTFAPGVDVYHFYGRLAFLVLAVFLFGFYGLSFAARNNAQEKRSRLVDWGYRLAVSGLALAALGTIVDYWVRPEGTLSFAAFLLGTILGLLLLAAGSIMTGVAGLRSSSIPAPASWALLLWFPFMIVLFLLGMSNIPAAPLLALSLAWAVIGVSLVRAGAEERVLKIQPE